MEDGAADWRKVDTEGHAVTSINKADTLINLIPDDYNSIAYAGPRSRNLTVSYLSKRHRFCVRRQRRCRLAL
ncbi:hypothetical protein J6590_011578 [Homalodisca vitripennis]|nr:hypothetical protein J6590_011578 [Homalodisca vitripennis]